MHRTKFRAVLAGVIAIIIVGSIPTSAQAAAYWPVCNNVSYARTTMGTASVPSLGPFAAKPFNCRLYAGQPFTGAAVKALQTNLNNCYLANIAADGVFGPATERALLKAQKEIGGTLVADGLYGPITGEQLLWFSPACGTRL